MQNYQRHVDRDNNLARAAAAATEDSGDGGAVASGAGMAAWAVVDKGLASDCIKQNLDEGVQHLQSHGCDCDKVYESLTGLIELVLSKTTDYMAAAASILCGYDQFESSYVEDWSDPDWYQPAVEAAETWLHKCLAKTDPYTAERQQSQPKRFSVVELLIPAHQPYVRRESAAQGLGYRRT